MVDLVRAAREELLRVGLLGDVDVRGLVPDLIVRSWRRSISNSVAATAVCQRYHEVDTDTVLCRAAEPVLERWQHQLADTGTTLFLSDRGGSIVARRTSDSSVRRRLDKVHAAEGFDYSEDSVGTNGLGTSMVERRPVWILGSQHYNDALAGLACAAVPVTAPTGSVIGSISLGGPIERSSPLMLSLTREIGQQIEERLRTVARPQDLALAMSFMRFGNSQRPTVVMDRESILANIPGVPYISVTSHVVLWELLNAHDWTRRPVARFPLETSGVEVSAQRILDGPRPHFVVNFTGDRLAPPATGSNTTATTVDRLLVVEGPAGSGRATVARDLHARLAPGRDLDTFVADPATPTPWATVKTLLRGGTDVLLRRVELLDEQNTEHLSRLATNHRRVTDGPGVLLLTVCADGASPSLRRLLDEIGIRGRTQALSATPERVPGLVKRILDTVDPRRCHTLSPAALQAFMQWDWPRNVTELRATLAELVERVPVSVIERRHLPKHLQLAPPRRRLTLMESAERDAIIRALEATDGNKSEAAKLLGVGRTTLYRRLRQLGLDGGEDSL